MLPFVFGDVLINEFLPNSVNTDYEWIELFNTGSSTVNLSNFNISEESNNNFTIGDVTIEAASFVILVRDETTFNQTYNLTDVTLIEYGSIVGSFNLNDSGDSIFLYNSSGELVNSILNYIGPGENISIGRFPDGTSNIINFSIQTPGNKNDKNPPVFNKWVNPSANNSFVMGLVNVTVNITDSIYAVNVSLINFNNSNFLMKNNGDLWYFLWNTSLNADGNYNITIFFNDTLGLSNTDTLFNQNRIISNIIISWGEINSR